MINFMSKPPTYEAYLEDYEQAYAAYCRCDTDYQRFPIGDSSSESRAACYRLGLACDDVIAAQNALMQSPAPDLPAVAFKMELLLDYMNEVAVDRDADIIKLEWAIAAAKAGDARKAENLAVPAVKWVDGEFPGRERPEKTILADLKRMKEQHNQ